MRSSWRKPFGFFEQFRLDVELGVIEEPLWFRYVIREGPPVIQGLRQDKLYPKLTYKIDKIRRMYYKDYPHEKELYSHSLVSGESRYFRSPMQVFIDRFVEITKGNKIDDDLAYLQCQEEKESREYCERLERIFCAHQAIYFYGVDPSKSSYDESIGGVSPYVLARKKATSTRRNYINNLILQRIANNDHTPLTVEEIGFLDIAEIHKYMISHPNYLPYFDENIIFNDRMDEIKMGYVEDLIAPLEAREEQIEEEKEKKQRKEFIKKYIEDIETTEVGDDVVARKNLEDSIEYRLKDRKHDIEPIQCVNEDHALKSLDMEDYEFETPVEYEAAKHFGVKSRLQSDRFLPKGDSTQLEHLKKLNMDLIQGMAAEFDIDLQSKSLFDTLSEFGRREVLLQWGNAYPEAKHLSEVHYFSSPKSSHIQQYFKDVHVSAVCDISDEKMKKPTSERISQNFDQFLKKWKDQEKKLKF